MLTESSAIRPRWLWIFVLTSLFLAVSTVARHDHLRADDQSTTRLQTLAEAIKTFNERAATDPMGKDQPRLTEEEVIAAIRYEKRPPNSVVSDELFASFKRIAETRTVPATAEFETLRGYENAATVFEVWSVRIRVYRPDRSSYAFIIRERMLRSHLIGPEERKVIAKWEKKWKEQGGIASFDRVEYARERRQAMEADRSKEK